MRRFFSEFSIVEFMIVIAILMILAPLVIPRVAASCSKGKAPHSSHPTSSVRPAR